MTTPNLSLPELVASQASKEITHNEALSIIDALLCGKVVNRTQSAEPPTPAHGDLYIVATGATGAFSGQSNRLAHYYGGAWRFYIPKAGWHTWVSAEGVRVVFDGSAWTDAITVGPAADTFHQCLKVKRNNIVVGVIDNNGNNIRVKANTVTAKVQLHNNGGKGLAVNADDSASFDGVALLKSYAKAALPAASSFPGGMIYVSDEAGGATPAFSDGTNWRRVADRAIVS